MGFLKGEKNINWKGDNVGYDGIHSWLNRKHGKANFCENRNNQILDFKCSGKSKVYFWAKKREAKYTRNKNDYIKLCNYCHQKYDHIPEKPETTLKKRLAKLGEKNCNAKLSFLKAKQIRAEYKKYKITRIILAKKYNVNKSTIDRVLANKVWIIESK